jgi:hypothetical protein
VNFSSGGFSSEYGGKLSSTMEIALREGNRTATDFQLDMSMQGFGGILEGPLTGNRGSYLISARRSYLDLLLDLMNERVGIPTYSDVQGKVTYSISDHHKISFIDVFSDDRQVMSLQNALDSKINVYPKYAYVSNTGGMNWQWIWGQDGFSNTSVGHTYSKTNAEFYQTRGEKLLLNNSSVEQEYKIRNKNHWILNPHNKLNFGFDVKYVSNRYDQFYSEYQDALGHRTDPLAVKRSIRSTEAGMFVEYVWEVSDRLTFAPGGRIDRYEYNSDTRVSPRISTTYHFSDLTALTGSYGVYYQSIPWVIAAQKESFRDLKTPRADHYIVSLSHLLNESTKLTVEMYAKQYSGFPMDPSQPNLFLFDQAVVENIFLNHAALVGTGEAKSRGIELSLQKKLAKDVYGLVAGSYYRSQYKGLDGTWYKRVYDNVFNVAIEGGYKPNREWEFSLRWLYAGGAPYTPFDVQASLASHKGVLDATRINDARLPDFHSLNIRVDKRWHFTSSTLVVYVSIWNAYGRKNVAAYTWNEIDDLVAEEKMWGTLPVFGIQYAF